jgi:hypothetical protein
MKRTFFAVILVFVALAQAGCGDGGSSAPPAIVASILTDSAVDGDIAQSSPGVFTVTQGMTLTVQSVLAGIHPATGVESRTFLDFPLTDVPANAVILSAVLDIVINSALLQTPTSTVPIRIDLVSPPSLTLAVTDFDLPALATTTIVPPISQADISHHVNVDVTALMMEAQRLGLADFRIRISEDLVAISHGLIEINDTTGGDRGRLAPLLQVTYF